MRADERIAQLRTEYKRTFGDSDGKAVLHDLAQICVIGQAYETNDPLVMANIEGRRKVFWRIWRMVYLDAKEPKVNTTPDFTGVGFDTFKEVVDRQ